MEKTSILSKYKKRSKIAIVNDFIILITTIAVLIAVILAYIAIATNLEVEGVIFHITNIKLLDYFIVPVLAILTMAGVISVVASNNKFPIALLVLSTLSTIYKFSYPLIQILAGQPGINTSPLIGQPILMFTLVIQVYFWIKWNKMTDEGKFISESFSGKRTYMAFSLIAILFLLQLSLSIWLNSKNGDLEGFMLIWTVFIDVAGSMLYLTASILMGFGNILCFPIFFLSDMTWLYWTIVDMITTNNALMILVSSLTLLQVLAYSILAITGFIQWFNDDYEILNKKIVRKKGRTLN